jgi:hypothetical protein
MPNSRGIGRLAEMGSGADGSPWKGAHCDGLHPRVRLKVSRPSLAGPHRAQSHTDCAPY